MTIIFDCSDEFRNELPGRGARRRHRAPAARAPGDEPVVPRASSSEYRKLTGVGTVVNTSFNMHEEPIVCTPQDAVRASCAATSTTWRSGRSSSRTRSSGRWSGTAARAGSGRSRREGRRLRARLRRLGDGGGAGARRARGGRRRRRGARRSRRSTPAARRVLEPGLDELIARGVAAGRLRATDDPAKALDGAEAVARLRRHAEPRRRLARPLATCARSRSRSARSSRSPPTATAWSCAAPCCPAARAASCCPEIEQRVGPPRRRRLGRLHQPGVPARGLVACATTTRRRASSSASASPAAARAVLRALRAASRRRASRCRSRSPRRSSTPTTRSTRQGHVRERDSTRSGRRPAPTRRA